MGYNPTPKYSLQRQVHPALALVRWIDGFGRNDEHPFRANLAGLQQVLLHVVRARLHQGAEIVWRGVTLPVNGGWVGFYPIDGLKKSSESDGGFVAHESTQLL